MLGATPGTEARQEATWLHPPRSKSPGPRAAQLGIHRPSLLLSGPGQLEGRVGASPLACPPLSAAKPHHLRLGALIDQKAAANFSSICPAAILKLTSPCILARLIAGQAECVPIIHVDKFPRVYIQLIRRPQCLRNTEHASPLQLQAHVRRIRLYCGVVAQAHMRLARMERRRPHGPHSLCLKKQEADQELGIFLALRTPHWG